MELVHELKVRQDVPNSAIAMPTVADVQQSSLASFTQPQVSPFLGVTMPTAAPSAINPVSTTVSLTSEATSAPSQTATTIPSASLDGNSPTNTTATLPGSLNLSGNADASSQRAAVIGGSIVGALFALVLLFLLFHYRRKVAQKLGAKSAGSGDAEAAAHGLQRQETKLSRFEERSGRFGGSEGRLNSWRDSDWQPHHSFAVSQQTLASSIVSYPNSRILTPVRSSRLSPPPDKPREVKYRLPLYHMDDDSYENVDLDPLEDLDFPSPAVTPGLGPSPSSTLSGRRTAEDTAGALAWWQATGKCRSSESQARYSQLDAKKRASAVVTPVLRAPSRAEVHDCDDRPVSKASTTSSSSGAGVVEEEAGSSRVALTTSPSCRSPRQESVFSERTASFVSAASSFDHYSRGERGPSGGGTETYGQMDVENGGEEEFDDLDFEMLTEHDSTIIAVATTSTRSSIQSIILTAPSPLARSNTLGAGDNHYLVNIALAQYQDEQELEESMPRKEAPIFSSGHSQGECLEVDDDDDDVTDEQEHDLSDEDYEESIIDEDYQAVPMSCRIDEDMPPVEHKLEHWNSRGLMTIRESRELLSGGRSQESIHQAAELDQYRKEATCP